VVDRGIEGERTAPAPPPSNARKAAGQRIGQLAPRSTSCRPAHTLGMRPMAAATRERTPPPPRSVLPWSRHRAAPRRHPV